MRSVALAALSAHKTQSSSGMYGSCFPGMGACTASSQTQSSQRSHLPTAQTSLLGFASEWNTAVDMHIKPWSHPLCRNLEASPSSRQILAHYWGWTWVLEEPGTLWQCPPSCPRKPHTQDPTLVYVGSPGLIPPALPTAGAGSQAFHPGLPLLMKISTKLVKKRACTAPWRMSWGLCGAMWFLCCSSVNCAEVRQLWAKCLRGSHMHTCTSILTNTCAHRHADTIYVLAFLVVSSLKSHSEWKCVFSLWMDKSNTDGALTGNILCPSMFT